MDCARTCALLKPPRGILHSEKCVTWLLDIVKVWLYSTFQSQAPGRRLQAQSCSPSNSAFTFFLVHTLVPMCLMGVLWRLLGGSRISHAALRLWCAWSRVWIGSMWIGTLIIWGHDESTWGSGRGDNSLQRRSLCVAVVLVSWVPVPLVWLLPCCCCWFFLSPLSSGSSSVKNSV